MCQNTADSTPFHERSACGRHFNPYLRPVWGEMHDSVSLKSLHTLAENVIEVAWNVDAPSQTYYLDRMQKQQRCPKPDTMGHIRCRHNSYLGRVA